MGIISLNGASVLGTIFPPTEVLSPFLKIVDTDALDNFLGVLLPFLEPSDLSPFIHYYLDGHHLHYREEVFLEFSIDSFTFSHDFSYRTLMAFVICLIVWLSLINSANSTILVQGQTTITLDIGGDLIIVELLIQTFV